MDSILLIGAQDETLGRFLSKIGYQVLDGTSEKPLIDIIEGSTVDVIVVDSRMEGDFLEWCRFLRTQDLTRSVPIVCLAKGVNDRVKLDELKLDRIESLSVPCSIGAIATRVATALRMRKLAVGDDMRVSIADANTALRDLNSRFMRELEEARSIQRSLLPERLPNHPAVDLAVAYEPLEQVGGDWYFAEIGSDGLLSVHIADVTGHGLAAAFIGSMTKLAMTAARTTVPNELLASMNRLMAPQIPGGRFVTMACYRYDPETGKGEFARAGHPPAMHVSRSRNEVRQIMGDGFAIGFFDDGEYDSVKFELEPQDLLVLITDGIPEAQNRGFDTYGMERLSESLLATDPKMSAGDVLRKVLTDFEKFCDGRILKDDVTVVVLKRRPIP